MGLYLYIFITIQLLIVSWTDLKTKKISNYWHVLNLVASIGLFIFAPEILEFKWQSLLFPFGFLLIGFLLFALEVMGAGDSKYLASLYLLIPVEFHLPFFEMLLITTLMIASVILIYRLGMDYQKLKAYFWTRHWQGIKGIIKSEFSYAPVILLAWIFLGVRQWT